MAMKEKPEEIRLILAQNIKKRRETLGLSQEKLAELTGLSVQTINTIEGCRMWVSDKTITQLARVLEIEIFQLFVPYKETSKSKNTSAANLLNLRRDILSSVNNLNSQIDIKFNEALKNTVNYTENEKIEKALPKPVKRKISR